MWAINTHLVLCQFVMWLGSFFPFLLFIIESHPPWAFGLITKPIFSGMITWASLAIQAVSSASPCFKSARTYRRFPFWALSSLFLWAEWPLAAAALYTWRRLPSCLVSPEWIWCMRSMPTLWSEPRCHQEWFTGKPPSCFRLKCCCRQYVITAQVLLGETGLIPASFSKTLYSVYWGSHVITVTCCHPPLLYIVMSTTGFFMEKKIQRSL